MPSAHIDSKEREPRVILEFFFSAHNTAADFEELSDAFQHCDLYVPEAAEWSMAAYQNAVAISNGTKRPEALDKKPEQRNASEAEDILLYNSQKPVIFADLPEGHPLDVLDQESDEAIMEARLAFMYGNFQNAVASAQEHIRKSAAYIDGRDAYIAAVLSDTKKITQAYPELKDKTEIRILVQLGIAHQSVARRISGTAEVIVTCKGSATHADQLLLKVMAGQEIHPDETAKAVIESLLFSYFEPVLKENAKTPDVFAVIHAVTSPLSLEDMRRISQRVWSRMDMDETADRIKVFAKTVEDLLSIKLPLNYDEVKFFLNQK